MTMNSKIYRQGDSRWSKLPYPTKAYSFGGNGCGCCAVTHCVIELDKYKNYTPADVRKYMVQFATKGHGTLWNGITKGLEHYGYKVHWKQSDSMSDIYKVLEKSLKRGVILFGSTKGPDGTVWTSSGHYIAFVDYRIKDGKHQFYLKDSGARHHDKWFTYEKSMRGDVRNVWICTGLKDEEPKPAPTPTPEPKKEETKPTVTTEKVIDVSYVQKNIDWDKVKKDGVKGVIVRCGYRGYGSGKLMEDSQYLNHIKGAYKAGLKVGVYFFTEAISKAEGKEEAAYAIKQVKKSGVKLSYPIAVDTEQINASNPTPRANTSKLSKAKRTEAIKGFCEEVKAEGYEPMIYASTDWLNNQLDMSKLPYKVWVAQYNDKVTYKGSYVMWQYSSKGKVSGISGVVDMNKCYLKTTPVTPVKYEIPTAAEIKTASNAGIRKRMARQADKIAADDRYHYVRWSDDKKTHECPICHDHKPGKYFGWNCIGFSFHTWHHAGLKSNCSCGVITDGQSEKILNAKTDADAVKIAQDRIGLNAVSVIRNKDGIPTTKLQKGDIGLLFKGTDYYHTIFLKGGDKYADCTHGRTDQIKTNNTLSAEQKKNLKVVIRYTGGYNYLQKDDEGVAVEKVQKWLNGHGFNCGTVDGKFGDKTDAALRAMQKHYNLTVDGKCGQKTLAIMSL